MVRIYVKFVNIVRNNEILILCEGNEILIFNVNK